MKCNNYAKKKKNYTESLFCFLLNFTSTPMVVVDCSKKKKRTL